jgi:hypothetical protein
VCITCILPQTEIGLIFMVQLLSMIFYYPWRCAQFRLLTFCFCYFRWVGPNWHHVTDLGGVVFTFVRNFNCLRTVSSVICRNENKSVRKRFLKCTSQKCRLKITSSLIVRLRVNAMEGMKNVSQSSLSSCPHKSLTRFQLPNPHCYGRRTQRDRCEHGAMLAWVTTKRWPL